ncbi:VWA domain-containing protein [Pirellulaceae bacterium SH449]
MNIRWLSQSISAKPKAEYRPCRIFSAVVALTISMTVWFGTSVHGTMAAQETSSVAPVVVIVLDDSGSMRDKMRTDQGKEARMKVAQQALKKLVGQLPDNTQLGLLLMNGARNQGGWLVPLGPLEKAKTVALIDQVRADGGTPLGRTMKTAMDQLLAARSSKPIGDYRLIVVTDGEATDGRELNRLLPNMVARGIVIDTIGVDMKSDHTLASKAHTYRRANDASSFESALIEIFAESNQATDDGSSSDFDLIAGLPDEFASEALAALAGMVNKPIDGEQVSMETDTFAVSSPGVGAAAPNTPPSGGNFWFIVAIVVFITIFLNGMLKSQKKR